MPRMNGFELLNALPENQFKVIFTTAYDEFAIKAIKVSAFDYLLKPIDSDELRSAIDKFTQQKDSEEDSGVGELIETISSEMNIKKKIPIPHNNGTDFIDQDAIFCCESSGNYTYIHLKDKKILTSKTLKHIEQLLNPNMFYRTHHSYVINLNHVVKYIKGEGGELVLSNQQTVKVSRSKKESVLMKLKVISAK